jgi:hypothetical protein
MPTFFLLRILLRFPPDAISWELWCLLLLSQNSLHVNLKVSLQYSMAQTMLSSVKWPDTTHNSEYKFYVFWCTNTKEDKLHSINKQNILFTAMFKYSNSFPLTADSFFLPNTTCSAVNFLIQDTS